MTFESGGACELNGTRALVVVVDMGIVDVEGGNGYSYGLERSKRYGVPTKSVSSSSFGLESLGGMEIGTGMGMGIDRGGILVITRYTEWVLSLPSLALWWQGEWAEVLNLNEPDFKVGQLGLRTAVD